MQIKYVKNRGVLMAFEMSEVKMALVILKSIHYHNPGQFLKDVINDIEKDTVPKLPHVIPYHMCEHCKMMMDAKDPNSFLMTTRDLAGKETSKWIHYVCKELKQRPI